MSSAVANYLLAAFCCASLLCCNGKEVIVRPAAKDCTQVQCGASHMSNTESQNTTLDRALSDLSSDTVLFLLPGCHCIEQFIPVYNLQNVSFVGGGSRSEVNISCASGLGLAFSNVSGLSIENITIEACGLTGNNLMSFGDDVAQYINLFFQIIDYYYIAMVCGGCSGFSMQYSAIRNTQGLGLLGINTVGNSYLHEVEFSENIAEGCFYLTREGNAVIDRVGGGALFIYVDYLFEYKSINVIDQSRLTVENCYFLRNSYCGLETVYELYYRFSEVARSTGYLLGAGGGFSILVTQVNYTVNASIESCVFRNNTARFGGGAHIEIFASVSDSHVQFSNCSFDKNGIDSSLLRGEIEFSLSAAALAIFFDFERPNNTELVISSLQPRPNSILVVNTNFTGNQAFSAGAVFLESVHFSPNVRNFALFEKCRFEENIAAYGAAFYAVELKQSLAQAGLSIILKDVYVNNNTVYVPRNTDIQSVTDTSSVIEASAVNLTIVGTSEFSNNMGTAIRCTGSVFHVSDHLTFSNNRAAFGGALRLSATSLLVVRNNTRILFHNNTGYIFGGAIYANYLSSRPAFSYLDCIIYFGVVDVLCLGDIFIDCIDITTLNVSIEFSDNSSPLGSIMYGSTLETCPWGIYLRKLYAPNSTLSLLELLYYNFTSPFNFGTDPPDNIGIVTTPESSVRINDLEHNYDVIPGERFNISVIGLDRFGRIVPVVLHSTTIATNVSSELGFSGYWFTGTDVDSTYTPVTIYGKYDQQQINVSLVTVASFAQTQFTVNLLNCTEGFIYEENSCVCDSRLESVGITCDSSTKNITIRNGFWIGTGPNGDLVVQECIQDYCRLGEKVVKPQDFDSQCNLGFNRTGILCGECKEGYSIVFGSNRCHKCHNSKLLLIAFFATAGIGIILGISFLQLTISEGYLNGVLFYSNIVGLYIPFFAEGSPVTQLFIPIAFLNLDLGIETCFYNGMDSLSRAWLHFLFPVYLYILMLGIILLAKRSDRIAKRFSRSGFSATNLFATLIMMSYTSLLQNCAEVLSVVIVSPLGSSVKYVRWGIDPNVEYFRNAHAPLGIISILLLVFYIIPAPFFLISPSCAFKLRIIQRLKPIYDAFWAPFKPQFRFWIGLRLLLRFIPFCFAYFILSHPLSIMLLGIFLTILLFSQVMIWPFKGTAQNAFDIMFICNILIMCLGALFFSIYTAFSEGYQFESAFIQYQQYLYFGITVSVGYIGFILILIWHLMLRFPALKSAAKKLVQYLKPTSNKLIQKLNPSRDSFRFMTRDSMSYGATPTHEPLSTNSDYASGKGNSSSTEEEPRTVDYTELREPLLDEGSLDLTPRTV